ncbi:MAG: hypothetical protein AB7S26_29955 [Sandaracinaceae bacterium]
MRWRGAIGWAAACVLTACSPALTCDEAAATWSRDLSAFEDPNVCATDADCVTFDPGLSCPNGARLGVCPSPIHADSVAVHAEAFADLAEDLCARVDPGCRDGPLCRELPVRCLEGRCASGEP